LPERLRMEREGETRTAAAPKQAEARKTEKRSGRSRQRREPSGSSRGTPLRVPVMDETGQTHADILQRRESSGRGLASIFLLRGRGDTQGISCTHREESK